MSFVVPLFAAIRNALKADPALASLVDRKIYDVVPGVRGAPNSAIAPPWIYLGPIAAPRFENDCFRGWQPRLRIFCASDTFGRDQVWTIVDAVDQVLDGRMLDLGQDYDMANPLRSIESGDVIDPTKPRVAFADFECVIYRAAPFDAAVTT